jgi:hypothetical protein
MAKHRAQVPHKMERIRTTMDNHQESSPSCPAVEQVWGGESRFEQAVDLDCVKLKLQRVPSTLACRAYITVRVKFIDNYATICVVRLVNFQVE